MSGGSCSLRHQVWRGTRMAAAASAVVSGGLWCGHNFLLFIKTYATIYSAEAIVLLLPLHGLCGWLNPVLWPGRSGWPHPDRLMGHHARIQEDLCYAPAAGLVPASVAAVTASASAATHLQKVLVNAFADYMSKYCTCLFSGLKYRGQMNALSRE